MYAFLIAYDIFDEKRLPKIKNIAYSFSLGGQRSALESPLSDSFLKELTAQLLRVATEEDKLNIIRFLDKPILLGKAKLTTFENKGIVII